MNEEPTQCSFCGNTLKEGDFYIESPHEATICEDCIIMVAHIYMTCSEDIKEKRTMN